jgi:hypothetical protein
VRCSKAHENLSSTGSPRSPKSARQPSPLPRLLPREELRLLNHLDDPGLAPKHLDARLALATRSPLRPPQPRDRTHAWRWRSLAQARTFRRHAFAVVSCHVMQTPAIDNPRAPALTRAHACFAHDEASV